MQSIILILMSFADSGVRFLSSFVYITNAPSAKVSLLYQYLALSNLLCIPFMLLIPVTYRIAHFGKLNKAIYQTYVNVLLYVLTIYLILAAYNFFQDNNLYFFAIIHAFFLGLVGTLLSIVNINKKLYLLQAIKVIMSFLIAITLLAGLLLNLEFSTIALGIMLSVFVTCCIALSKIETNKFNLIQLRRLIGWLKLGIFKYRGAIINSTVLLVYINIDRLIVTKISDDIFVNKYALATTICAPIVLVGNVLHIRYWPLFAKKNSNSKFIQQTQSLLAVSVLMSCCSFLIYFTFKFLDLFSDRIPDLNVFLLVVCYYSLYPVTQFLMFFSGLKNSSIKSTGFLFVISVWVYFYIENTSQLFVYIPMIAFSFLLVPLQSRIKLRASE